MPVGDTDLVTVSSTDFFSPISLDPYIQGRIAAANTLSDLYAAGCVEVSHMLMILACSTRMELASRRIVTEQMVSGFRDLCAEAGVVVTGGQSILNPWPILGGVAIATVPRSSLVAANKLVPGDVLVLTKPLGTQVAANLALWMLDDAKWTEASKHIDALPAARAVQAAELSMASLNRDAAKLMRAFGAHGATDVTGFGILGHARNLAGAQEQAVDVVLDTAPIIEGLLALDRTVFGDFRLRKGLSAETSGGLLVAFEDMRTANAFLEKYRGCPDNPRGWGWTVGGVVPGSRQAYWTNGVDDAPAVLEV
mmetsp:Transcript_99603/g.281055  ORF Transcript_99603/g.281055 Transcript_99603/m.281055 type:complete len:309 (+) Transcript_99603:286-1212(+)